MSAHWTAGLNPEQQEAVLHSEGPLLILAGAGSGKTTVLVARTGHILETQGVQANQICVLTFTNKAARELKHRVKAKIGPAAESLWTGTFHSFGLRILRRFHHEAGLPSSFGVIDQGDAESIAKELLGNIKNTAKDAFKPDRLISIMNSWRETGRRKAANPADEYEVMAEVCLPKYLKRLDTLGVVDFEGLLLKPLELFKNNPEILRTVQQQFKYVMVDEFQDTNKTQFKLVQALVMEHGNIGVVGDDDQSIYGWRGAEVRNILDFPKHFSGCQVIRLERNYRSTPAILSVANNVIEKNKQRHGKVLKPNPDMAAGHKPEVFVYENDDLEVEETIRHINYFKEHGYTYSDIAILYRSNGQGGLVEGQLRQNQIPYSITGGQGFFDRKETKDVLAYMRTALSFEAGLKSGRMSMDEVAFRRILNTPPRGIGETTVEKLEEHSKMKAAAGGMLGKTPKNGGIVVAARDWRAAGVQEKIGQSLEEFFIFLANLPGEILGEAPGSDKSLTAGVRLMRVFDKLGYRDYIRQTTKDPQGAEKRWMIIDIMGRVLDAFLARSGLNRQGLREFLDSMELRDTEDDDKDKQPKVQLLTLHACKGLEFKAVLLMGVEEDLLPHRSLGGDVSEERRLFYVGVTRAKERLILTRARTRKRFGRLQPVAASRFLEEIKPDLLVKFETGYRPVGEEQRKGLLSDLLKKLETNIVTQRVEK